MASRIASQLKTDWMEMSDKCFEPLTFGGLKIGQKFICLPEPGDNNGHGGFKKAHRIFTKTHQKVTKMGPGFTYAIPHGRVIDKRGVSSDFPNCMLVIIVK